MIKHFVEFDEPGILFPETSSREVKDTIPANLKNIPKYTYAISYYDLEVVKSNGRIARSEPFNRTIRILFGTALSLKDIQREHGESSTLYRNLVSNHWPSAVKCITGNYQPKIKGEIVLASHADLKTLTDPMLPLKKSNSATSEG